METKWQGMKKGLWKRLVRTGTMLMGLCMWHCSAAGIPALAQGSAGAPAGSPTQAPGNYIMGQWWAFGIAMGILVVVLILTVVVGRKDGMNFFQSPDGAVSVSRAQVWMWTMAIIFAYVYLFLWHGPPDRFPDSLWELMGISALSTGVAKYIAVVSGKPDQPPSPDLKVRIQKQSWWVSMLSDDGQPSMMRLQMFGWTVVTIFLFLMYVHRSQALWDVPTTLVILMGISHVGYLGDKGAAASKA